MKPFIPQALIRPMAQSFDPRSIAVLVVQDEPLLLYDAVETIEEAGFTAYGVRSADEAIRTLERRFDIRIMFTDIDVPGSMDGLKLAHAVKNRWPPITIMVTSGMKRVSANDLPESGIFLPKPYPSDKVVGTLKEIAARVLG
jgi:CheY-like chemotaxis protein